MSGQTPDPTGAKILDGAMRVLGDFGVKRATVELVAKYAGVSHMTIYRRWPSKSDLLRAAVVGELSQTIDSAFARSGDQDAPFADRALSAFTDIVWTVQNHPLVIRELDPESGEPMPPGASSAVMESSVPLVAARLRDLAADADGSPTDLDAFTDVFVRLAHSLVTVKSPDHPLTTRAQVEAYADDHLGPYFHALAGGIDEQIDEPAAEAAVVNLEQHRDSRNRAHRPYLQIAAASLLSVLTLGAGLTAVLNGTIKVPFITPANISKSEAPQTPGAPPSPPGMRPASQDGAASTDDPQPAEIADQLPADALPPVADQTDAPIVAVPLPPRPAGVAGSLGGGAAADSPVPNSRAAVLAPAPAPAPQPAPGPQPPAPGPQPPAPGPKPPAPGPQPGPKPPAPAPKPPAPAPAPKPPAPGPKPPGPGPGPGPQGNQQAGSPN